MKRVFVRKVAAVVALFMAIGISQASAGEPEAQVHLGLLPPTLPDFLHLQEGAVTPERGATLFIMAMLVHEDYPGEAEKMFIAGLTDGNLVTDNDGSKVLLPYMKDHLKRLANDPAIARSYVEGATPQNNYTPPQAAGYTFNFSRNRLSEVSETEVRVFVKTSGAGTPRPVSMKKQPSGIWKAEEVGSLFVGVYLPRSASQ